MKMITTYPLPAFIPEKIADTRYTHPGTVKQVRCVVLSCSRVSLRFLSLTLLCRHLLTDLFLNTTQTLSRGLTHDWKYDEPSQHQRAFSFLKGTFTTGPRSRTHNRNRSSEERRRKSDVQETHICASSLPLFFAPSLY
jgi:hypothetical protein